MATSRSMPPTRQLKRSSWLPTNRTARWCVGTATVCGALGAVGGLMVGLAYPPTAVFAALFIGVLSTVVGAALGLGAALTSWPGSGSAPLVIRCAGAGGLLGLLTGAVLGTAVVPVYGTFAGAAIGSAVGLLVGVSNVPVLLLANRARAARRWAVLGCCVMCAGLAAGVFDQFSIAGQVEGVVICGAVGGAVGGFVVRPIHYRREP